MNEPTYWHFVRKVYHQPKMKMELQRKVLKYEVLWHLEACTSLILATSWIFRETQSKLELHCFLLDTSKNFHSLFPQFTIVTMKVRLSPLLSSRWSWWWWWSRLWWLLSECPAIRAFLCLKEIISYVLSSDFSFSESPAACVSRRLPSLNDAMRSQTGCRSCE